MEENVKIMYVHTLYRVYIGFFIDRRELDVKAVQTMYTVQSVRRSLYRLEGAGCESCADYVHCTECTSGGNCDWIKDETR